MHETYSQIIVHNNVRCHGQRLKYLFIFSCTVQGIINGCQPYVISGTLHCPVIDSNIFLPLTLKPSQKISLESGFKVVYPDQGIATPTTHLHNVSNRTCFMTCRYLEFSMVLTCLVNRQTNNVFKSKG